MADSLENEYAKYKVPKIYLSYEGIKYEVLRDKYIAIMSRHLKKYANKSKHRDIIDEFLLELTAKFREQDQERMAERCNSGRNYEENFENVIIKGRQPKSVEAEKRCVHIIRDLEWFFDTKLLSDPEERLHKKNEYIHSLILPLIEMMVKTDLFYYIPHTSNALGYRCYWNQLKMIEDNIEILFEDEKNDEVFRVWQEILEPLRKIIGDGEYEDCYPGGDYPGIESNMWLEANPNLAYFDCVYDVAEKDYQLYEDINTGKYGKLHFSFSIGKSKEEVKKSVEKRRNFFATHRIRNNYEAEIQAFYMEFKQAYLYIVKEYLHIDIFY